ncbi:MAG TPA: hypothetical protein VNK24_03500 [Elusimicrobiota bacterium]|nr:hypothetical protein [Elusimicrobiota bacterium]
MAVLRGRIIACLLAFCAALAPLGVAAQALSSAQQSLLSQYRYQVKPDGSVWAPDAAAPLDASSLQSALSRAAGAQRLKALLQVDMILDQSGGKDNLTPEQTERIKDILRKNWTYFPEASRADISGYFSPEEIDSLDAEAAAPAANPASLVAAPAPVPEDSAPAAARAASDSLAPAEQTVSPAVATAVPVPVLDNSSDADSAQSLSMSLPAQATVPAAPSATPIAAPPPPPVASSAPVPPAPAAIAAVPAPAQVPQSPAVAASAAASAAPVPPLPAPKPAQVSAPPLTSEASSAPVAALVSPVLPSTSALHPAPAAPMAAPVVTVVGAPARAVQEMRVLAAGSAGRAGSTAGPGSVDFQIFPLPLPSAPPAVSAQDVEKLLQNAPYTQEVVFLLRQIEQRAGLGRNRALGFLLSQIPAIVVAPRRCGAAARGCLETQTDARGETLYTVVLDPGPLLVRRGALWFKHDVLLPDAPEFYSRRHLSVPDFKANQGDALAQSVQDGSWGKTSVYADGSRRGTYSREEMAGTLLKELLLADAAQEGWDASPYYAQVYARTAQEIFYAGEAARAKGGDFLDPDALLLYQRWENDPDSLRDELVHSLSATRAGLPDFLGRRWDIPASGLSNPTDCELRVSAESMDEAKAREAAMKEDAAALERAGFVTAKQAASSDEALSAAATSLRSDPLPAAQCLSFQQRKEMGRRLALSLAGRAYAAQRKFFGVRK